MYKSWREVKDIPASKIKVGDIADSYKQDGLCCSVTDGWEITDVCGAFVTIKTRYGISEPKTLSTEGLTFQIPLTEEEYRAKYHDAAQYIVNVLNGAPTYPMEWYSHTLDNSWTDIDAWDMASACIDKKIEVIGWFPLENFKTTWAGDKLDMGIIAKDTDEPYDIFWTHYKRQWVEDMTEWFYGVNEDIKE